MKQSTAWNDDTISVVDWLKRDYQTDVYWSSVGRTTHLAVAGESSSTNDTEARRRLAQIIKEHVAGLKHIPLSVQRWNEDHTEVISIEVTPPRSTPEIQWEAVADYILLGACTEWQELCDEIIRRDRENAKRQRRYQKILKKNPEATPPDYLPPVTPYECIQFPPMNQRA